MLLPVCVQCKREMYCIRNGFSIVQKGGGYIQWGDHFKCRSCDAEIVVHFGNPVENRGFTPDLIIK